MILHIDEIRMMKDVINCNDEWRVEQILYANEKCLPERLKQNHHRLVHRVTNNPYYPDSSPKRSRLMSLSMRHDIELGMLNQRRYGVYSRIDSSFQLYCCECLAKFIHVDIVEHQLSVK